MTDQHANARIATALDNAYRVHRDQVDARGRPYLTHLLEVAADVAEDGTDAVVLALIHDTLEDGTERAREHIRREYADQPAVLTALEAITRREGEPYLTEYIPRVCRNDLARIVKLADVERNLHSCPSPTLRARYLNAWARLDGYPETIVSGSLEPVEDELA